MAPPLSSGLLIQKYWVVAGAPGVGGDGGGDGSGDGGSGGRGGGGGGGGGCDDESSVYWP